MALRPIDRVEIGNRVQTVREMANMSARQLRLALDSTDSNLVADIEGGKKKIVDFLRLRQIAEICEGRGQLASVEAEEILGYLTGRIDWDTRPKVRLAGEAAESSAHIRT